jgi:hypothetical protein
MDALKWIVVALLFGSSPTLAQGTGQTIMPSGPGGSYGSAEPIGSPGRPVATPHYNNSFGGAYATPATPRTVIVQPRRRR